MREDEELDTSFYITGWIMLGIAGIFFIIIKLSGHKLLDFFPPCWYRMATGYYCPGCGATRALASLMEGHLLHSVRYHAFVPYLCLLGGWFMFSQTIDRISGHRIPIGFHFRYIYVWIGLVILFGNFLAKDLVLYFVGIDLMP